MIIVMITFLILLVVGVPVGFSIAISGFTYFFQHPELPITTVVQLPISQTQNITLLAVPLFVFAGSLMNASGITDRLIELSMLLCGHMKGGMAQVSVVLSALMGGISGSSNADAAMESRILGPEMERQGYPKGYTGAVIGYTSLITCTIPPGVGMILYGTTGEVSIGRLFAAGMVAGLLMTVILMATVGVTSRLRGFKPARESKAGFHDIIHSLKDTIWAMIFPILLLVGIRFGLFTPSEVGSFACVYALIVGFFIYKKLNFKRLIETLKEAVVDVGAIMFMISMSGIFGYGIPFDKVPQKMTAFITGITTQPLVVMAIIIIALLLFGMFMEGSVVILLLTPILLPMVKSFGFDPVFFGIIVSTVVTTGILTPPVGVAMYTVCSVLGCTMPEFLKESIPFLIAIIAEVVLLCLCPEIILWAPRLMYGG